MKNESAFSNSMGRSAMVKAVFLFSLFIAAALGFVEQNSDYYRYLNSLLVIGGLLTGSFLIGPEVRKDYLVAALAIIFINFAGGNACLGKVGTFLSKIFEGIVHFVSPSAIVVCIKTMFDVYRSEDPGIFNVRR